MKEKNKGTHSFFSECLCLDGSTGATFPLTFTQGFAGNLLALSHILRTFATAVHSNL